MQLERRHLAVVGRSFRVVLLRPSDGVQASLLFVRPRLESPKAFYFSVALGAGTKAAQKWADDAPTGLVLELTSVVEPTIQALLVSANGLTVSAGVQSDSVGARGLAWVTSKSAALAHPLAGERPLVLPAAIGSSGPGQIFRLNVEAASVFDAAGIQGGVVVVTPTRGTSP